VIIRLKRAITNGLVRVSVRNNLPVCQAVGMTKQHIVELNQQHKNHKKGGDSLPYVYREEQGSQAIRDLYKIEYSF